MKVTQKCRCGGEIVIEGGERQVEAQRVRFNVEHGACRTPERSLPGIPWAPPTPYWQPYDQGWYRIWCSTQSAGTDTQVRIGG